MNVAKQVVLKERLGFFDRRKVRIELARFAKLTMQGYDVDVKKTPLPPHLAYTFNEHVGNVVAKAKDEKLKRESKGPKTPLGKAWDRIYGAIEGSIYLIVGAGLIATAVSGFVKLPDNKNIKDLDDAVLRVVGYLVSTAGLSAIAIAALYEFGFKNVPDLFSKGWHMGIAINDTSRRIAKDEMKLLK